jgi:sortase A
MILKWTGRGLIAAGVLVLLFVVYQLVGTNLIAKQNQRRLEAQLKSELPSPAPSPAPSAGPTPSPSAAPSPSPSVATPAELGSGIAIIEAPKIGLHSVVVEGVSVQDLRKGPGHFPNSAMPGGQGNVVISGHRTTYGAPFSRLNELSKGDVIQLVTTRGTFDYQVTQQRIVAPTEVSVIAPTTDLRLTLTTCHPKFSASQRLIVIATLLPASQEVPAA